MLRLVAASGLGLLGATALRGSNISIRRSVVASGHVQRLPVGNATVYLARRSGFAIGGVASPMLQLWGGQVAVDIESKLESLTLSTPLANIIVNNALLSAVVDGTMLVLTVIRGAASVIVPGEATSSAIEVKAGQEMRLRAGDARPVPIAVPEAWRKLEWLEGWLMLRGETLVNAAAAFNRFNLVQIVVTSELSNLIVDGEDRHRLTDPHGFALRVARSAGLDVIKDHRAGVIRLKRR